MTKHPPILTVLDITKNYYLGDVVIEALRGVNLKIQEKEMLAILGPSGCGKSTLMHILGLLDEPTRGKVFLDGKDVSQLTENQRALLRNKHIGFVFQSFNLLARTTAIDNVELPLVYSNISSSERRKKAIETLKRVGLGDRLEHYPTQLSGGQQQRVAIARALVNNPRIVLADEPTGNLDSKSGVEIIKLLRQLNDEGNTIVIVTHDQNIAKNTKRIVYMKDGVVIKDQRQT